MLPKIEVFSPLDPPQVSSLNKSHIALVSSTWEFGSCEFSDFLNLEFPFVLCVNSEGCLVWWVLTSAFGEMEMVYRLQEHRQKGYTKALVTILMKKLHSEGYSVYCFIELENQPSYRLFTGLGSVLLGLNLIKLVKVS